MPTIATAFETVMIICFGLSWPFSVYKSWKSRTTKGKTLKNENKKRLPEKAFRL